MLWRGVVFDLDGTLADTLATIAAVVNASLAEVGLPPRPVDDYRLLVGDGIVKLCERVLPPERHGELERFVAIVRRHYAPARSQGVTLYDGIEPMLRALAALRAGLAVLSNKPHDLTVGTLEDLGIARWFGAVQGQSEEFPPKPDPAAALALVDRMRLASSQVLYVGDTGTDMQTAVNARLEPVGALWGFRDAGELLGHGARHLVARPAEVVELYLERSARP